MLIPDVQTELTNTVGPCIGATLVTGLSVKLPNTASWLVASPDVLTAAGIAPGSQVLVGLTNQITPGYTPTAGGGGGRSGGGGGGTPGRPSSPAPASLFAPAALPDLTSPSTHLLPLLQLHNSNVVEDDHQGQHSQPGDGPAGGAGSQAGKYVVATQAWSSSKLPKGVASVSPVLLESLGAPAAGAVLALFAVKTTPGTVSQPADAVVLKLCYDMRSCQVACAQGQQATVTGSTVSSRSGAGNTPASPATPSMKTPPPGSSSKRRDAAESGKAPDIAYPATANTQGLSDWVLQLLHSSPATSTANGRVSGAKHGSSKGGGVLTAEQRQLLNTVATSRLIGRTVIQHNPVTVPLLGHTLICTVTNIIPNAAAMGQQQREKQAGLVSGSVQAGHTQVLLLLPGEDIYATSSGTQAHLQQQRQTMIANTSSTGTSNSAVTASSNSRGDLRSLVSAGRAAAESAVGAGGAPEAAAAAAERAITAGWSASGLDYTSLGGVSHLVHHLRELVTLPLKAPHLFKNFRVRPPRGVLLHGPPGSGKTVLARAAAGDAGAVLLVVNGPDVMSEFFGESEAGLQGVFAAARALAPAIVFIDEIDAVAPARGDGAGDGGVSGVLGGGGGGGSESASRLVTALLTCMDGTGGAGPGDGVVVLGATNRPGALDPALRRPGRLERELAVGAPPPEQRRQILEARLRRVHHNLAPVQIDELAYASHGFVAADLAALVNEAALAALRRLVRSGQVSQPSTSPACPTATVQASSTPLHQACPQPGIDQDGPQSGGQSQVKGIFDASDKALLSAPVGTRDVCVTWDDFQVARARVRPSSLRELAVEVPRVSWDDIGGLQDVKQRLQEAVVWPFKAASRLSQLGAVAPRGVLLYGPPGCSKTLLAKAVAAEAKLNFLSIKGGELFSKYVGQTEKAVSALFARARATSPTIIFFDEIDSLAAARGQESGGLADRVMAQLLTEMDGLQQRVGVVVLAATNRPDCVDPALLRPGRFDRLVYVPPPDTITRYEILKVHLRKTPVAEDVDLQQIASGCEGYSGADLGALAREAALAALEEDINTTQVHARHFTSAQQIVLPSGVPSAAMQHVYASFSSAGQVPGAAAQGPTFTMGSV